MTSRPWQPGDLLRVSNSYWEACTLHAGVKLGVFSLLSERALTAGQVARKAQTSERGTRLLLDALCAMELLGKNNGRYRNTEQSQRYLVQSSADYVGYMILHHQQLSSSWTALADAVTRGQPVGSSGSKSNAQWREAFLMGMYTQARLQAPQIVRKIDLKDRARLLDIGGGPGTYAIAFCQSNPQLHAVVLDLPGTRPFAEQIIKNAGLEDRIHFQPGDYKHDNIAGGFDVIWISHILHAEGPQACRALIQKAAGALDPGGLLLVHDFFLNETMDGPLFPALFALNMLLGTELGQSYSERQVINMLENAGIADIRRETYSGPTQSGIMSGKKPF